MTNVVTLYCKEYKNYFAVFIYQTIVEFVFDVVVIPWALSNQKLRCFDYQCYVRKYREDLFCTKV